MTISLKGTYRPARGLCKIEIINVVKEPGEWNTVHTRVIFKDGSSVPATDILELLLRKEIVRTT